MMNLQESIMIALIAFAYSDLMTEPNMLFNGLFNWLHVKFKTDERAMNGKPVNPFFMFLMYCSKCVAGQIAFWYFLKEVHSIYLYDFFNVLFIHLSFVAQTIVITAFLKEIYKHTKHD